MSMEENLRKYIDELIQEVEHELDEATTTAGVDGYQTPFAFGSGRDKDKKKQKKNIDVTGYTKVKDIDESVNEGIIQDREKELKRLQKGAKVSGGGYGPFVKIGSNSFKNPKTNKLYHSAALASLIGTFKDFKINESYKGTASDFKTDISLALDSVGISPKAIKKISKKGKGFELRMSSYMKDKNTWEKLGKEMGAKLVDFQPGSINIGLYESVLSESKLKPKKLTQLKKGEKFVFNNTPYEFLELYTGINNAAKVKKEDGKTSVVSFGGGVVNKNTKGGFSDYLKQGGRVWDNVNPTNSPSLNEKADYKYLTQVILDAKPKYDVYYNSSHNVVNIGGVGYDKGDLVKNFNQKPGSSSKIKNNFYHAHQDPQKTKREVEKLSKGKIKVKVGDRGFLSYSVNESVNEATSEKNFKLGTPAVFDGDRGEVVTNPKTQRAWTPNGWGNVSKGVKGIMIYGSNTFIVPDWSKTKKFNESVNEETYKVAGRPVTLIKGKKPNGTDWKVKFQNGKETSLSDVLSLIKPFPKGIKESVNEAKTYKKGDKLKIKLKNGKKFDVVFDVYAKQKGVAFGKFKDGSGEYDTKPFDLDTIVESVNEAKVKRPVNRWLELKNDDTMHPHKKMAMGLKELKYQLAETEKFFNWYNKIKTMNELDSQKYWKRTQNHIYKIKERLVNIARTIKEIEK